MLFSFLSNTVAQGLSSAFNSSFIQNNIVRPFSTAAFAAKQPAQHLPNIKTTQNFGGRTGIQPSTLSARFSTLTTDLRTPNNTNQFPAPLSDALRQRRDFKLGGSYTHTGQLNLLGKPQSPRSKALTFQETNQLTQLIDRLGHKVVCVTQDELGIPQHNRLPTVDEYSAFVPETPTFSDSKLSYFERQKLSHLLQKCCVRAPLIHLPDQTATPNRQLESALLVSKGSSMTTLESVLQQKLGMLVNKEMITSWLTLIQMEKYLHTPEKKSSQQQFETTSTKSDLDSKQESQTFYQSCVLDLHPLIELCARELHHKINSDPAAHGAVELLENAFQQGIGHQGIGHQGIGHQGIGLQGIGLQQAQLTQSLSTLNNIKETLLKTDLVAPFLADNQLFQQHFPSEALLQGQHHAQLQKEQRQQTQDKLVHPQSCLHNSLHNTSGVRATQSPIAQNTQYQLGQFNITLNGADNRLINIKSDQGTVFASPPGESLFIAGTHSLDADENRGSFHVLENSAQTHDQQHITSIQATDNQIVVHGLLTSSTGKDPKRFTLAFEAKQHCPDTLSFHMRTTPDSSFMRLNLESQPDEAIFGMGEQYTYLNLKGQYVPVLSQENGIGRSKPALSWLVNTFSPHSAGTALSSYTAAPFMFNGETRGLFLTTKGYSAFDFTKPEKIGISTFDGDINGQLISGPAATSIENFTQYAGRARPFLPHWTQQGAITGLQGGRKVVEEKIAALKASGVPIGAVWLQDMVGKRTTLAGSQLWWNWEVDENHYQNWDQMVSQLNDQDIKVMGYINPYLVDPSDKPHKRNLFQEACQNGYLVLNQNHKPYMITNTDFDAGMVDLSNPLARRWYKEVIKTEYIDRGLSGWMADFSEGLPFDAVMFDGSTGSEYHHKYIEAWAQLNQEAIDEAGKNDEIVFFSRAGFTQTPQFSPMSWSGDQLATWDQFDGFKSAVNSVISASAQGYSNHHTDIGGYTSMEVLGIGISRKPELFYRWMEFAAFTPVFRSHEGLRPSSNIQSYSHKESQTQFAKWAKLFTELKDYRHEMAKKTASTGIPLVRHMTIDFPNDKRAHQAEYQFTFGDDFLVAPMVDPLTAGPGRQVYLPEGKWTHLFTGEEHSNEVGQYIEQTALMDCPPVYFKSNSKSGQKLAAYIEQSSDFTPPPCL